MHLHKILNIASPDMPLQNTLNKELGISRILAQVLINRGINNPDEADKFLNAKTGHLLDPYSFSDMRNAVNLIRRCAENKEKVMACGDYDTDGITGLALLKDTLCKIGMDVTHYLPHRIKNGYGLNKEILQLAKQKNIKLLITVDCGISNYEYINELRRNKIEVIITDHHQPQDTRLPPASCILNPKVENSGYGYKDLAGVGVAYKLCQAITGKNLPEELDLVSLGTIADVVPLLGENRIFVKEGLSRISATRRVGLKALMEVSGIKDKPMNAEFVSYILSPRINASGRIDSAQIAFNLLMSEKKGEADELAKLVNTHNRQRQKIESKVLDEAQTLIDKEINFKEHKIIVIAKEGWHQGVLGIVASKLMDKFYRPTILISKTGDLCKGSGRSIKSFHLFKALSECRSFLKAFGGHKHAAGLVICEEDIENFKNKINSLANENMRLEDLLPRIEADMELGLLDLNETFIRELKLLEPFGSGNPPPLFYSRNLKLKGQPQVLGRDTLKFWVSDGNITYPAIGFRMGSFKESLLAADFLDLAYTARIDNWQGKEEIILEIQDMFFKDKV